MNTDDFSSYFDFNPKTHRNDSFEKELSLTNSMPFDLITSGFCNNDTGKIQDWPSRGFFDEDTLFHHNSTSLFLKNTSNDFSSERVFESNTPVHHYSGLFSAISEPQIQFDKKEETIFHSDNEDEKEITGKDSPYEEENEYYTKKKVAPKRRKTDAVTRQTESSTNTRTTKSSDSKNIVKNYGKAIATFSLGEAAKSYLTKSLLCHGVSSEGFKNFVINRKETIDSIESFRILLSPSLEDEIEEVKFKAVFRDMSEVFIKNFALNWIFSNKSRNKEIQLKYRFKMLRRVQNPSNFTFLKRP